LEIQFLGVGGYLIRVGEDAVLTPPMYTNPDFFATTLGDIASDPALVAAFTEGVDLSAVRAIFVGHAHYDHLLDAPTLWPQTNDALFYGNASMRHILAAYAPDRAPDCDPADAPEIVIPRDRVVEIADVDQRMCRDQGTGEGAWNTVPGTNVRFRALCSAHPDQIGPIHFAPGDVEQDQCTPPAAADDWSEGPTLAFLIDFLDDAGAPVHRVYYQDAPTDLPYGMPHPSLLAEHRVDVALLNVGSYDAVADHPAASLRLLAPRYAIGGHWEDFFRTQDQPLMPILGHDVDAYAAMAEGALSLDPELPAIVDGAATEKREWVPAPGTSFRFPAAEAP
jgi:L-ascorbate metabolism protein UlaG (beta-lactamase superfamily)